MMSQMLNPMLEVYTLHCILLSGIPDCPIHGRECIETNSLPLLFNLLQAVTITQYLRSQGLGEAVMVVGVLGD